MEKTQLSCQLAFYPLETKEISREVKKVLEIINKAPVYAETNALSTSLMGEANLIFSLLEEIATSMDLQGTSYTMQISISNYCACR